jgi:hypothetical protein
LGAVCPQEGRSAALVLPFCDAAGMNPHITAISGMVRPGQHMVLQVGQAEWHLSGEVKGPTVS